MLLAYVTYPYPNDGAPQLCLIPDKVGDWAFPVRIETLIETFAAIHRIGNNEAIKVTYGDENSRVIEAVSPAHILLTPQTGETPGILARKIKVVINTDGFHETFFLPLNERTENWRKWNPNRVQT